MGSLLYLLQYFNFCYFYLLFEFSESIFIGKKNERFIISCQASDIETDILVRLISIRLHRSHTR